MLRISEEELSNYRELDTVKDLKFSMHKVVGFALSPIDGYWENVTYYGEGFKDPTDSSIKSNWVYVMVNPSMPGIVKIGYTTTSIPQRVKELNAQTSSITPWYPTFSYKCPNGRMLEEEVHTYLENRGLRVNDKREGFTVTTEEAATLIRELGQKYQS